MAGTITGYKNNFNVEDRFEIVIDWTSDASGDADANIAADLLGDTEIYGNLKYIETAPGANGDLETNLPTAAYDITIKDEYGLDIETLTDRSGTLAEKVSKTSDYPIHSELALVIDAAGATKQGRIILFFEK